MTYQCEHEWVPTSDPDYWRCKYCLELAVESKMVRERLFKDARRWAAAWKAAAKNRYGRQRHIIKLLEWRMERLLDHSSCIHCGELIAENDPGAKDHWQECSEHPANKRIKELEAQLESELATIMAMVRSEQAGVALVEALNAEINRLQSLLDWNDNTCGKALTRVAELDEENLGMKKNIDRQRELLGECYILLERHEEGYLGPVALLRQKIAGE